MKFPQVLLSQIILYIRHWLRAGHRKGMGIHPPFAFRFVSDVVFGKDIPGSERIEELRNSLSGKKDLLKIRDYGAGSRSVPGERRSVQSLVKNTAVSRRKGQLLARIAAWIHPSVIIELGAGTGFSGLYMALGSPSSKILSCEGSEAIANLARRNADLIGTGNLSISTGRFADWLPGALEQSGQELVVFLDGDHRGERLLEYCRMILENGPEKIVMVLDDIHWSADMYRAWKSLLAWNEITLSLELFNTGIAFLGYDIQKGNYIIRF